MITIHAEIDREELAGVLDIPMSELDATCANETEKVIAVAEGDLEDYVKGLIMNHDIDMRLVFEEAIANVTKNA